MAITSPELKLHHVLRDALAAAGLTQTKLAELVGVDQSTVSRWVCGRNVARLQKLKRRTYR